MNAEDLTLEDTNLEGYDIPQAVKNIQSLFKETVDLLSRGKTDSNIQVKLLEDSACFLEMMANSTQELVVVIEELKKDNQELKKDNQELKKKLNKLEHAIQMIQMTQMTLMANNR